MAAFGCKRSSGSSWRGFDFAAQLAVDIDGLGDIGSWSSLRYLRDFVGCQIWSEAHFDLNDLRSSYLVTQLMQGLLSVHRQQRSRQPQRYSCYRASSVAQHLHLDSQNQTKFLHL